METINQEAGRLLPVPTRVSKPYWDGCKERRLRIQKCPECGTHLFYPVYMCHHCTNQDLEWVEVSGRGTVYSFSVVHRAPYPALAGRTPYIVALIELEEGPVMMSNIVGAAPDAVRIGDAVTVDFEEASAEITMPVFRLAR